MPAATSQLVGDAARAAVDALNILIPGTPNRVPSVKRKTPSLPEGTSANPPLPQFVISVGAEARSEYVTATQKLKTYPVAVTIVSNTGQQQADDNTVRLWRQQIELALENWASWSNLPGFNDAVLANKAPFDTGALSKDYSYATVVAEVQILEVRG
jgi:hypothetical protein